MNFDTHLKIADRGLKILIRESKGDPERVNKLLAAISCRLVDLLAASATAAVILGNEDKVHSSIDSMLTAIRGDTETSTALMCEAIGVPNPFDPNAEVRQEIMRDE